jgi:hypothetical protein
LTRYLCAPYLSTAILYESLGKSKLQVLIKKTSSFFSAEFFFVIKSMDPDPDGKVKKCETFRQTYKQLRANQLRRACARNRQMRARRNPERMFP